jgi:hypothetical protein
MSARMAGATILLVLASTPTVTAGTATAAAHLGVASCASTICHGSAKPRSATAVRQNEYVTWQHFDPHAGAYDALTQPRGREIARRLGLEDATRAPQCLACHAEPAQPRERGPRFQVDDGVGCESCHGASDAWISSHYDTPRVQHADNVAAGMRALDLAAVRAQACMDCHVGGPGQFATHRMMAAGHPRLAFELDTYTELWRTSGGREHYRQDAAYRARKAVPAPADVWIAGLIAQARRQLALLLQPDARGAGLLPEFALFNCYSCHRQMALGRWAERRPVRDGTPGELRFDDAAFRLLAEVVATSRPDDAEQLHTLVRALQAAPGRDWAAVRDTASALDASIARLATAPPTLSTAEARTLTARLVAAVQHGDYPDYASAEQVAMSLVVLRAHLGQPTQSAAVDELFDSLRDDDRFDAQRFRRLLERAGR